MSVPSHVMGPWPMIGVSWPQFHYHCIHFGAKAVSLHVVPTEVQDPSWLGVWSSMLSFSWVVKGVSSASSCCKTLKRTWEMLLYKGENNLRGTEKLGSWKDGIGQTEKKNFLPLRSKICNNLSVKESRGVWVSQNWKPALQVLQRLESFLNFKKLELQSLFIFF